MDTMNGEIMIAVLLILALAIIEGVLIDRMIEYRKRNKVLRYHEKRGKLEEEIVCMNAIVVFNGSDVSWYDKDKLIRWEKK